MARRDNSFQRHRGRSGQSYCDSDENVHAVVGSARIDSDQRGPHHGDGHPQPANPLKLLAQQKTRENRTNDRIGRGRRERMGRPSQDNRRDVPTHEQWTPEHAARPDGQGASRGQNTHNARMRSRNARANQQEQRGRRIAERRYSHGHRQQRRTRELIGSRQ
jgi:hypothetical protein